MPVEYLHGLTAKPRTPEANLHLGIILAIIAGALNAGGFLAVNQYTSHMTGMVSMLADQIVLGQLALAMVALVSWLAFVSGAAFTAIVVSYQRRHASRHVYALPLLTEALLILVFGSFGGTLQKKEMADVSLAVLTLCFTMGLQNALITKISRAEIRTTHVTGLTTDLGIELGKLLYWNRSTPPDARSAVRANRGKLRIHLTLIGSFLAGGLIGAWGFKHLGFIFTLPMALVLAAIAVVPLMRHRKN